ncbi:heme binding [Haplosporangium sp. Z 27]|nr:heme binding [Haplosporangium sp. Z 27]
MSTVVLETSMGEITIELYTEHAPRTCKNFYEQARKGYYNDVVFHRIIPDFMIQGGDPTGTGRGGASIYGDKFEDEFNSALKHTGAGIVSMANSGPNTNGSQFFITLAPTPWLDNKHTIFGRVSGGIKVVNRMGLVATDKDDRPKEAVKIIRARQLMPRKGSAAVAAASKSHEERLSSESGEDHEQDHEDHDNDHDHDQGNEDNGDGSTPIKRKRLTQACDPCRKKKVKCDGIKPRCANCAKINANCTYLPSMKKRGPRQGYIELLEKRLDKMEQMLQHGPAVIDPELLESKATFNSPLRPGNRHSLSPGSEGHDQNEPSAKGDADERYFGTTSGFSLLYDDYENLTKNGRQVMGPKYSLPPTMAHKDRPKNPIYGIKDEVPRKEILEHLIELFFDSIYFQIPIIHPGTFMKQYKEGKVSPNLLNAMCAAVARFSDHPDVVTTPAFLAGEPFATNVRGMLVDSIDIPTVSNVQALVFLSMYEYGAARGPRAWMFGGMAVRQAQELGLNREDSSPVFHLKGDWVMRETRRRTFWACFMLDVLASSSSGRPRMMDERDCEVLLPSEDEDWCDERPVVTEMLYDGEDSSSGTEQEHTTASMNASEQKQEGITEKDTAESTDTRSNGEETPASSKKQGAGHVLSSFAYLIRIVAILGKVSQYVNRPRSKKSIPPNQRGSEFSVIDAALSAWHKSIPPHLAYSLENGRMIKDKGEGCIIVFMHVIYYTAVVLLHRPILAADKAATPLDIEFVENSVTRCTNAANRVSDVLEFVQAYNCPPRIYISSFFAYPVFTTATIHITNAFASDPAVAARARRSLSVHVRVLQTMKSYWSMADKFFYIIRDLYSIQSKISSTPRMSQQGPQNIQNQPGASSASGVDNSSEDFNALTSAKAVEPSKSSAEDSKGITGKLASISSFLKSDSGLIALWRRATEMQVLDEAKQEQKQRSASEEAAKQPAKLEDKEYSAQDRLLQEHRERMNALEIQQINQEFDRRWKYKMDEPAASFSKGLADKSILPNVGLNVEERNGVQQDSPSSSFDKRQPEDDSNPRATKQVKIANTSSNSPKATNQALHGSSDQSEIISSSNNDSPLVGSGDELTNHISTTYRHSVVSRPQQLQQQDSYILQPMQIQPTVGSSARGMGSPTVMNSGEVNSHLVDVYRQPQQHQQNDTLSSIDMVQNANLQRQQQQLQLQQEQAAQMSSLAFGSPNTFTSSYLQHAPLQTQHGFSPQGQMSGVNFGLPLVYGSNYDTSQTQRMQTESLGSLFDFALPQEDISFLSNSFQVTPTMMQENLGFSNIKSGPIPNSNSNISGRTATSVNQSLDSQSPNSDPSNLFSVSSRLHSFLMSDDPYNGNTNSGGNGSDNGRSNDMDNGVQATPTNLIRYLQLHHQQELHQQELRQQQNMQPVLNQQNSLIFDDFFPWNQYPVQQQQQQQQQQHQQHHKSL